MMHCRLIPIDRIHTIHKNAKNRVTRLRPKSGAPPPHLRSALAHAYNTMHHDTFRPKAGCGEVGLPRQPCRRALACAWGVRGRAGRVGWGGRSGVDHTRGISTSNVPSEGSHHSPKNVGSSPSPSRRRSLREMIVPAPCRSAYSEPKLRAEVSVFE